MEQLFSLPADALSLSFDYLITTSGTPNGSPPNDFQSSLLDVVFTPILPGDPLLGPAYYSIDNLGNETFDASFVTVSNSGRDLRAVGIASVLT